MNILIDGQTFETPEIHRGIGIYTKSVINNMLKLNYEHSWYICVSDDKNLNELDPWVKNKLHIIKRVEVRPEINYLRNAEYTQTLQEIVNDNKIDLVWIPNMLMVNVLALDKMLSCRVCVTVYDIIPYLFPIKEWASSIVEEYHRRLEFLANENVELLFISEATKEDFEKNIGKSKCSIVTPLAADAKKFYGKRSADDSRSNIILFTGGFDYRKNIDGAIDAFELALKNHDQDKEFEKCKLVIVGSTDQDTRKRYENILRKKHLENRVELTGYISDEELGNLYKRADVFFFPSLYEGFGLPILEAMLGGDYVVSADNSSLPEVCGGYALLCNAQKTEKMAEALYKGFRNSLSETIETKNERQEYALQFSWEKTAQKTLNYFERDNAISILGEKSKLAILTPWPEQKTGIANYEYKLVPYLLKYFEIDIFTEAIHGKCRECAGANVFPLNEFTKRSMQYKHVLYEIGNNADFHKEIFEALEKNGGIAEIHDYILTPFFFHSYFLRGNKEKFGKLLENGYGAVGNKEFAFCEKTFQQPDMNKFPMSHSVVKSASKIIFHNHWSAEQFGTENINVIPLACFDKEKFKKNNIVNQIVQLKQKYHIKNELVIGCFGWVNANKRPQIIMDAVSELLKEGYQIKLCFWGEAANNEVVDRAKRIGLQDEVIVSGYLDKESYEAALEMTDIVVNLRYPSMGESSATLCEAFKYGKAVIVSDLNQYREFPDEVCWKVPICNQEKEILKQYLKCLMDREAVRDALGENAQNYADNVLSPTKVAAQYYNILEK